MVVTFAFVTFRLMNGPSGVLKRMASHFGLKVVCRAGYTGELVANQGVEKGIRLLEKPFTRGSLRKVIDAALG